MALTDEELYFSPTPNPISQPLTPVLKTQTLSVGDLSHT